MIYNTPFRKIDSYDNEYAEVKKEGAIIFGTGNLGSLCLHSLKKKNINPICFVDNNFSNWDKKFNGYDVISPEQLKEKYSNKHVFLSSLNFKYLKRQLESLGIKNIHYCDDLFSNFDLDGSNTTWSHDRCKVQLDLYNFAIISFQEKKKLSIQSLDLVLTEKCSLKCKDCSNLMQFYAKPIDEDYNQLIESLDKFMKSVDYVYEIRLIGGEPFMYKKIDEVLTKILTYKNCGNIIVYTNGTIVPNEQKLKTFKNDKIYFKISNYGSISRNVEKLEKTLKEKKIHYITERVTKWQDCAKIENYDRPLELTKQIFGNCCVNEALTLLHGKLYLCPFAAHAENLHAIPKAPEDSIDLLASEDHQNFKKRIRNLAFEREYLEACKSCNGRDHNVASVDAAIQTKEPLLFKKII